MTKQQTAVLTHGIMQQFCSQKQPSMPFKLANFQIIQIWLGLLAMTQGKSILWAIIPKFHNELWAHYHPSVLQHLHQQPQQRLHVKKNNIYLWLWLFMITIFGWFFSAAPCVFLDAIIIIDSSESITSSNFAAVSWCFCFSQTMFDSINKFYSD